MSGKTAHTQAHIRTLMPALWDLAWVFSQFCDHLGITSLANSFTPGDPGFLICKVGSWLGHLLVLRRGYDSRLCLSRSALRRWHGPCHPRWHLNPALMTYPETRGGFQHRTEWPLAPDPVTLPRYKILTSASIFSLEFWSSHVLTLLEI